MTAAQRKGDWMQVASGRPFWPFDPRADEVHVEDIAHGLSMLCRFGGHTQRFYSVAEHSVWCSLIVPPEHAFQALMHDATEAYCVDIPRPLKRGLSNYADIEAGIWSAVCDRFGIAPDLHASVKVADNAMCLAEARQIMSRPEIDWSATGEAAAVTVQCWSPEEAKRRFLERFAALTDSGTADTHAGSVREAADYLDQYAQFIRDEVKAADLERHPYLPALEQAASDLRALHPVDSRAQGGEK